ncbi:unnamed protein product [Cylicostephanus goldi]|uniref:Uncharacterized protein n=1 Tax=Cylicostephanus goldi TaxID=71465 RepID=A0A3P7LZJ9_CYLGO|nr:unnamed protein product [Cylicostephanus goldi]
MVANGLLLPFGPLAAISPVAVPESCVHTESHWPLTEAASWTGKETGGTKPSFKTIVIHPKLLEDIGEGKISQFLLHTTKVHSAENSHHPP